MELCSLFIDILAFKLSNLCSGVETLFCFYDPGARDLHWKAVPGAEILTEKIVVWEGGGG